MLTFIKANFQYNDNEISIEFPVSENELCAKLMELHAPENTSKLFLAEMEYPSEFAVLENTFVNLDELNFLAKRMESFCGDEDLQFFEAMKLEHFTELKDLINLTFNVDKFTLIQDVSDMRKIGRTYLLDREGSIPAHDEADPKYAAIGRELLQSGNGIFTEHGLLFPHRDRPFEEPYQGQTFPEYFYNVCLLVGEITYQDKTEYVYLPDDGLAISKAIRRLGAEKPEDCQIVLSDFSADDSRIFHTFQSVLDAEGIYEANRLAKAVNQFAGTASLQKLSAVMESVDAGDAKSLVALAENLDAFGFAPNIQDHEDLGRWWIDTHEELELSPELEDYFDYDGYGKVIHEECSGEFLQDGGYVYLEDGYSLEDILDTDEDEGMALGGI